MRLSRLGARVPTLLKLSRRPLMNSVQDWSSHFLLEEAYLVKDDETFLKFVSEKEFIKIFGDTPSVMELHSPRGAYPRQLAIVLPLQVSDSNIVPIPFILNTGAAWRLYLGTKTLCSLKKAQLIKDCINGRWPYHLLGTLSRGEKLIQGPVVDVLPIHSEEPSIKGDLRTNVLGIIAVKMLDIMHC